MKGQGQGKSIGYSSVQENVDSSAWMGMGMGVKKTGDPSNAGARQWDSVELSRF